MSDPTPTAAPFVASTSPSAAETPATDANGQLIVALAIVAAMLLIALGLILAGVVASQTGMITGGVFTIIGALATALNAPTGVSSALRASRGDGQ